MDSLKTYVKFWRKKISLCKKINVKERTEFLAQVRPRAEQEFGRSSKLMTMHPDFFKNDQKST